MGIHVLCCWNMAVSFWKVRCKAFPEVCIFFFQLFLTLVRAEDIRALNMHNSRHAVLWNATRGLKIQNRNTIFFSPCRPVNVVMMWQLCNKRLLLYEMDKSSNYLFIFYSRQLFFLAQHCDINGRLAANKAPKYLKFEWFIAPFLTSTYRRMLFLSKSMTVYYSPSTAEGGRFPYMRL